MTGALELKSLPVPAVEVISSRVGTLAREARRMLLEIGGFDWEAGFALAGFADGGALAFIVFDADARVEFEFAAVDDEAKSVRVILDDEGVVADGVAKSTIAATKPASSSRARASSTASRERRGPISSPQVFVVASKAICDSSAVAMRIAFDFSSASARDSSPAILRRNVSSLMVTGKGDSRRGSTRTRATSSGIKVVATSVALIKWPVVETVANRTSVARAMRIVGSCSRRVVGP